MDPIMAKSSQLDYIQGMGFTAVWITPITKQIPQTTAEGTGFHGYWQQDMYVLPALLAAFGN
jgi:glycosidase